jgi:hypothetical protein
MTSAVPVAGASSHAALDITIDRAPVTPDGTTAGAITDFVLTFRDRDPAVDGIGLLEGATVTVTLPDSFVDTGSGANAAILLQGWPQSPPAPPPAFPWTTTVSGTTITATLDADYLVGATGPGFKQVHLLLNSFRNPGPGRYDIELVIQPDPASSTTYEGTGSVQILPWARPSVNVVSVFSGGAPPPLNNPLYQTVGAGDDSLDIGMYLWDRGSSAADGILTPYVGVDLVMANHGHGRLVQDGRTVGHVWMTAPPGADDHTFVTDGPSFQAPAAVTGFETGVLITRLETDPDVTGDYTVTIRLNNGNSQRIRVTAE